MQKLRGDLLVGFDPVGMFLSKLQERFGHLLDFGVDMVGGSQIGLRWKTRKPLLSPLDPATAFAMMPAAAVIKSGSATGLQVSLQMSAVLQDILDLCPGLVTATIDTQLSQ